MNPDHPNIPFAEQVDNHPQDHDDIDLNIDKPHGGWVIGAAVLAAVLLGLLLVMGWVPRLRQAKELRADAAEMQNAPVVVNLARPKRAAVSMSRRALR